MDWLTTWKKLSEFKCQHLEPKDDEILIYGVIGGGFFEEGVTSQSVLNRLKDLKDREEINVRINSPGGLAAEGVAIYNALFKHSRETSTKINVHIDALAASAASVIAMSGDRIIMADNATMMIHEPFGMVIGTMDDMMKGAEILEKIGSGLINTYSKRTDNSKEDIKQMMAAETWFTAEEAVDKGFADEVLESKSKPEARVDLSVYNNVPAEILEKYKMEEPKSKAEIEKNIQAEAQLKADEKIGSHYFDNKKRKLQIEEKRF